MDNKKILGLDIGTTSIGWAIVEAKVEKPVKYNEYANDDLPETKTDTNNDRTGIHIGKDGLPAVGVRIISQEGKMLTRFNQGKKLNEKTNETPTAKRRRIRGGRKLKSRYKLRRDKLCTVLEILGMLPDASYKKVKNRNGKWLWEAMNKDDLKDIGNGKWYTKIREYEVDEIGKKKKKRKNEESIITGIGEDLYKLRNNASISPLENKKDWGRILLHLNQSRGYSSDRYSSNEDDEQTDDGYYTSLVIEDIREIKRIYKDKLNKKLDKIQYQVQFENGVTGIDEVKVGEKSFYSKFKKGEVATYKKTEDENDKSIIYVIWQNLKKDAWAYRKWLINDNIDKYIQGKRGTVGSYFYNNFFNQDFIKDISEENRLKRIRNNVVNRNWYEDEFEIIWKIQFEKHKASFTQELIDKCIDAAFTKDKSVKQELQKIKDPEQQLKRLIKDKIIYFQRPWQQSKNKGECRFEKIPDIKKDKDGKIIPNKDGSLHYKGRAVIPRGHPIHQEYKIWQQINNVRIRLHPKDKKEIELLDNPTLCVEHLKKTPTEIKELLYERLQDKKEQSWRTFVNEIFKLDLKIKKEGERKSPTENEYYSVNYIKISKKGEEQDNLLKGNKTKKQLDDILNVSNKNWYNLLHVETNRKREEKQKDLVKSNSCKTPISNLQLLWECLYDLTGYQAGKEEENKKMIAGRIRKHFSADIISDEQCKSLAKIKFEDAGMGQLSAKAIRNLLPLMAVGKYANQYPITDKTSKKINSLIDLNQKEQNETNDDLKLYSLKEFITDKNARIKLSSKMSEEEFKGLNYWEAAAVVYGNHSKAGVTNIPSEEIADRIKNLQPVPNGKMNNPIVEKIVNETIKLVQLIYQTYEGFDEVRIELSRELKNSMEDREAIWDAMNSNNKRNDWAKQMLREMFNEEESKDVDVSFNSNNIDKIKIIEDVVANLKGKEYEEKRKKVVAEPTKVDIIKYRCWLEQEFKCPYTGQSIPFSDVFAKQKKVEIEHIIPRQRYPDNSYSNKVITWVEVNSAKAENGNRTAYEFIVSKRDREFVMVGDKRKDLIPKEQWEETVKEMFKGRKAKNLLRSSIPEDPINRELKDTQYINKKLREKIGEAIGMDKVWTTTGQITDMLRNAWHLNDKVMKELVRERYQRFQVNFGSGSTPLEVNTIFENKVWSKEEQKYNYPLEFPNFSKRLDHRHHALDAIIVACTKQQHIQLLNTLNAQFELTELNDEDEKEKAQKRKYKYLQSLLYEYVKDETGKPRKKYFTPWEEDEFIPQVKDALSKIIVAHKNSNVLTSPSKNRQIDKYNYTSVSIRQGLHKETLIGKRKLYNKTFTPIIEIIERVFIENRNSNKHFDEIIIDIVFKEKFQKQLINLFEKFASIAETEELKTKILEEINRNKSSYFESATTFDLIPIKRGTENIHKVNIDKIIDPRIQRYRAYKDELIDNIEKEKNRKPLDERKKELEKKKKLYLETPIYYNALYDVRMKDDFEINEVKKSWLPLFEFNMSMIEHIEYVKNNKGKRVINHNRTEQIKKLIKEYKHEFTPENILIEHPIIVGEKKIEIKKATVESTTGNNKTRKKEYDEDGNEIPDKSLLEIRPKTFVEWESKFRAFIIQTKDGNEKKVGFIEFKEALDFSDLKSDFIQAEIKIPNKLIPPDHKLLFTLSKNDLVVLPDNINDSIDWKNISSFSNKLFRVLDFDSTGVIRFVKHTIAAPIELKDKMNATGLSNQLKSMNEKLDNELKSYEIEKEKIDNLIEDHSAWKKNLSKEDLKFQKITISNKEAEIKSENNLVKEHSKEIENLKKEIKNLTEKIAFNSKSDKNGKVKEAGPIQESFERKSKDDIQKVIKVFTDKLGKKIIPYWEFENGCWDKESAKKIGLLNTTTK
jgi:CRISPR/Cas system Type II protein with McrA/HNH and RuvC-like nuclease domain